MHALLALGLALCLCFAPLPSLGEAGPSGSPVHALTGALQSAAERARFAAEQGSARQTQGALAQDEAQQSAREAIEDAVQRLSQQTQNALASQTEGRLYSRMIEVPGAGLLPYYAQNDAPWNRLVYESYGSTNYRLFGAAGCGPTAAAIAIARQLPQERLPELIMHARDPQTGFPFCSCSVNLFRCDGTHEPTCPVTMEDFSAYLPVIFASYAAGNNPTRTHYRSMNNGTSSQLFRSLADAYGLSFSSTHEWARVVEALSMGCSVITTVGSGIFTANSHYLVIASVDDSFLYILDPYIRESYDKLDPRHILEIVEPGLVRASLSDLSALGFSSYYIIGGAP